MERKTGIVDQIKMKEYQDQKKRTQRKLEQAKFNKYWDEVNRRADQNERNKRIMEVNLVSEEMHKLEAKRLRDYAEAQIEKERARKMNLKLNEKYNNGNQRKKRQALGELISSFL